MKRFLTAAGIVMVLIGSAFPEISLAAKIKHSRSGEIYEGTIREITATDIDLLTAKGIGVRLLRASIEFVEWPGVLDAPENFLLGETLALEAQKLMEAGDYSEATRKFSQARRALTAIQPEADKLWGKKSKRYHTEANRLIRTVDPKASECRRLQQEEEKRLREEKIRKDKERGIAEFDQGLRAYLAGFAADADQIFDYRNSAELRDAFSKASRLCHSGMSLLALEPNSSAHLQALTSFRAIQIVAEDGANLFELTQTASDSETESELPLISVLLRRLQQELKNVSGIDTDLTKEVSAIQSTLQQREERVTKLAELNLQLKLSAIRLSEAKAHFDAGSFGLGHQVCQETLAQLNQIDAVLLNEPRREIHSGLLRDFAEINVGPEKLLGQMPPSLDGENFDAAERICRILIDSFPESPETAEVTELVAGTLFARALEIEQRGDRQGAGSLYRKISNDYPESAQAGASQKRIKSMAMRSQNRLLAGSAIIAILLSVGLGGYYRGQHCQENLRLTLFDRASVILAKTLDHFESRTGAAILFWVVLVVPAFVILCLFTLVLFVITALYLPCFIVMRVVHWFSLIYRGIVYQCPYQDDGSWSRFRNPIHVCECGESYRDLRPGFYGLLHHTCRNTQGHKGGKVVKLPTLDLNGRNRLPRLCAGCERPLIHGAGFEMPVSPVALVGSPSSGKTVFMRQMIEAMIERFGSKRRNRIELDSEDDQNEHANIMEDLSWGDLPRKTAEVHRAMGLVTVIPDLQVRCLLHVFDAPGERFGAMERTGKMQVIQFLRGIVLLVDPFAPDLLSENASALRRNAAPTHIPLGTIVDNLINGINSLHLSDPRHRCQIPIAVVISKIDQLDPSEYPHFTNVKAGESAKRNLTGQPVRDALVQMGGESCLRMLENKFTDTAYFACSALGGSPSELQAAGDPGPPSASAQPGQEKENENRPVPVGLTEPMLFLIGHKHFKRRRMFS